MGGYLLEDGEITDMAYNDLPNKAAEACAIRLYDVEEYPVTMRWSEQLNVHQSCILGQVGCLGSDSEFSHYGNEELLMNVEGGMECGQSAVVVEGMRLFKEEDDDDFSGSASTEPSALEHHLSNWVMLAVGMSFGMLMLVMSAVGVAERNLYFEKERYASNSSELQ